MSRRWSSPALQQIAELVAQRTGIATERNPDELERAARQIVQARGLRDLDQLAARLSAGKEWEELIDQVTVRETYFFRSPEHFEYVATHVLPALDAMRAPGHPLRIWSAGCASGEEPYSLAILLDREGKLENASIFASDVSQAAIERARAGRYREWSFRAMQPELVDRYFESEGAERVIAPELRAHVNFSRLNLLDLDTPEAAFAHGPFDLIFCRNVLIYFDSQSVARIERALFDVLSPGGFLIGGPSDPPLGQASKLEVVLHERWVCYRKPVLPPPAESPALLPLPAATSPLLVPEPRAAARPKRDSSAADAYADAEAAFQRADYARVIEIARRKPSDVRLCILGTRAVWNLSGASEAERTCQQALRKHGLSAELHYLHAIALVDCDRLHEALRAVRQALYLDRALTIAHFAHASILERLQNVEGARRAYRNTYFACSKHAPDEALPLGDGIVASGLANAAARALEELSKRCPA
ncbi:MAG TPA: protein-glutamate O-methyltransferase CheR [Polyangiales bacterium]|nr:protein-glutamate O-methyltransferase CheR [Polyangiales bacterium]